MPGKLTLLAVAGLLPALIVAAASDGASSASPRAANNAFRASLISECVRARRPQRVRALAFDGTQLPASVAAGHEPGSRPRCRRDELRLLRFGVMSIGGERTYVRRGGCALPCVVRQATVHVPASALARPVSLLPRSARNGNGAPVAGCTEHALNAPQRVGAELRRMYYKTPAELHERRNAGRSGGIGASWANYGNPGATYRSPGGRRAHYNYLLWNLPRTATGLLPGGGIIRAILRDGQPLALCSGQRLALPGFDRHGAASGTVEFAYARVRSTGAPSYAIHGWVLTGYHYRDRAFVATVAGTPRAPDRVVQVFAENINTTRFPRARSTTARTRPPSSMRFQPTQAPARTLARNPTRHGPHTSTTTGSTIGRRLILS